MSDIKKISELNNLELLNDNDLFIVSKSEPYKRFSSKSLNYNGLVQSLRKTFEEELENLNYINNNFVDDSTLTFTYDKNSKKIILNTGSGVPQREIDVSDFLKDGMLDNATYDKKKHQIILTFNTSSGKNDITIDISDLVDVYYAGNGLCCENKIFSIDSEIVSLVGHTHENISSDTVNYIKTNVLSSYYNSDTLSSADQLNEEFEKIEDELDVIDEKIEDVNSEMNNITSSLVEIDNKFEDIDEEFETVDQTFITIKQRFEQYQLSGNYLLCSDVKTLAFNDLSDIVDDNDIKIVNDKLSLDIDFPSYEDDFRQINQKFDNYQLKGNYLLCSDVSSLAFKDLSDIVDNETIMVNDNKLSVIINTSVIFRDFN